MLLVKNQLKSEAMEEGRASCVYNSALGETLSPLACTRAKKGGGTQPFCTGIERGRLGNKAPQTRCADASTAYYGNSCIHHRNGIPPSDKRAST